MVYCVLGALQSTAMQLDSDRLPFSPSQIGLVALCTSYIFTADCIRHTVHMVGVEVILSYCNQLLSVQTHKLWLRQTFDFSYFMICILMAFFHWTNSIIYVASFPGFPHRPLFNWLQYAKTERKGLAGVGIVSVLEFWCLRTPLPPSVYLSRHWHHSHVISSIMREE